MTGANQAVIFTKPFQHLTTGITGDILQQHTEDFLLQAGFTLSKQKEVSGTELDQRQVIPQHYCMYSYASAAPKHEFSPEAQEKFQAAFNISVDEARAAGQLPSTKELLANNQIDTNQLYVYWIREFDGKRTHKVDEGVIVAWIDELNAYCVNGFYPPMEANFIDPSATIHYYCVEFDPEQINWEQFRSNILGVTNAKNSDPESLRGKLYAEFPSTYPGRDNFVHGSAGPLEALLERSIHEADFELASNPVGAHLQKQGITLDQLKKWKRAQSTHEISYWFDLTEEINTAEAIQRLDEADFCDAILKTA